MTKIFGMQIQYMYSISNFKHEAVQYITSQYHIPRMYMCGLYMHVLYILCPHSNMRLYIHLLVLFSYRLQGLKPRLIKSQRVGPPSVPSQPPPSPSRPWERSSLKPFKMNLSPLETYESKALHK